MFIFSYNNEQIHPNVTVQYLKSILFVQKTWKTCLRTSVYDKNQSSSRTKGFMHGLVQKILKTCERVANIFLHPGANYTYMYNLHTVYKSAHLLCNCCVHFNKTWQKAFFHCVTGIASWTRDRKVSSSIYALGEPCACVPDGRRLKMPSGTTVPGRGILDTLKTPCSPWRVCPRAYQNLETERLLYVPLLYLKEKETHILNFLTSDFYWENYFSKYQQFISININNLIPQQNFVIFVNDAFHLPWRHCHVQVCTEYTWRKPKLKNEWLSNVMNRWLSFRL